MSDSQSPAAGSSGVLDDLALLALVVAHGTDGALHRHEVGALLDHFRALEADLGGDAEAALQRAAGRYDRASVGGLEEAAGRVAAGLDADARARAFAALVAVAEADGVVRTMEATVLRHLAQAWGLASWPAEDEAAEPAATAAAPPSAA